MGLIRMLPNGSSISYPRRGPEVPAKRGRVRGWTAASARSNVRFLWSVESESLGEGGHALTLTMGGRPSTSVEWSTARARLLQRLREAETSRYHWVTEWTAAGRPHLHMALWNQGASSVDLALMWLEICDSMGWPATLSGQHVEDIFDATGWLKYVAKHSARGVQHYQRETPPEGWGTTGRLWGASRTGWPRAEEEGVYLSAKQTARLREGFVLWQAQRMLDEGVPSATVDAYLENLDAPPEVGAPPRGVSGWIPWETARALVMDATEFE